MNRAILLCLLVSGVAAAQDPERGRLLYETHCSGCHTERLHARTKSRVASMSDLRRQVARWTRETGRAFTDAEREDLAAFLDATHYHLEITPAK